MTTSTDSRSDSTAVAPSDPGEALGTVASIPVGPPPAGSAPSFTPSPPPPASASTTPVVINGGANVRLRLGDVFLVREAGREITDPVTGNVIEITEGKVVGKIQVRQVNPASAHAVLLEGSAQRGNTLATAR